jgi:hypothetical protein
MPHDQKSKPPATARFRLRHPTAATFPTQLDDLEQGDLPDNVERMHPEHPTQTRLFDDQPELYRNRRPPGMSDPDDEEDEGA